MSTDAAGSQAAIWWISLGLGVVVLIVVILLLSLLVQLVRDVDDNVGQALAVAGETAANTAAAGVLAETASLSTVLHEEVRRHAAVFVSKAGQA